MKKHKEIRWSEVARQAIEKISQKLELLDILDYEEKVAILDSLLDQSYLTQMDVDEIDNAAKQNVIKKLLGNQ